MGSGGNERPWLLQDEWNVRFDWGPAGAATVTAEAVVIVDVLRFTTAVDAAVTVGGIIIPYLWNQGSAREYAAKLNAVLAGSEEGSELSLSPLSLRSLAIGDRVVLPSPNGSTCSLVAQDAGSTVYAACLRNATAVGQWVAMQHKSVTVVACGERWPDGSMRPSIEDYLGAGAVLSAINGVASPEARLAAAAWTDTKAELVDAVSGCVSGQEAITRGWAQDLEFACQVDVSETVPVLNGGGFVNALQLRSG